MKRKPAPAKEPVSHERVCACCARSFGADGTLPSSCDWHVVIDALRGVRTLVMTCSSACRAQLGYSDRKKLSA